MKNENKKAFFIIILILIISISAVIFTIFKNSYVLKKNKPLLLKIPNIQTTIHSDNSKKDYIINLSLYLNVIPSLSKKIDISQVHLNIEKLVSSLNFDEISNKNNIDYIKSSILEDISNYTPKNSIKNVYINDIKLSKYYEIKHNKQKKAFPKFTK